MTSDQRIKSQNVRIQQLHIVSHDDEIRWVCDATNFLLSIRSLCSASLLIYFLGSDLWRLEGKRILGNELKNSLLEMSRLFFLSCHFRHASTEAENKSKHKASQKHCAKEISFHCCGEILTTNNSEENAREHARYIWLIN